MWKWWRWTKDRQRMSDSESILVLWSTGVVSVPSNLSIPTSTPLYKCANKHTIGYHLNLCSYAVKRLLPLCFVSFGSFCYIIVCKTCAHILCFLNAYFMYSIADSLSVCLSVYISLSAPMQSMYIHLYSWLTLINCHLQILLDYHLCCLSFFAVLLLLYTAYVYSIHSTWASHCKLLAFMVEMIMVHYTNYGFLCCDSYVVFSDETKNSNLRHYISFVSAKV